MFSIITVIPYTFITMQFIYKKHYFAYFLHSADIQSTGASLAAVTDNELDHTSIDDHGEGSHLLAPDEECIIGEKQATADRQHAHLQECEGSFDGSLCEQPDVTVEVDTSTGPSQSIGDMQMPEYHNLR